MTLPGDNYSKENESNVIMSKEELTAQKKALAKKAAWFVARTAAALLVLWPPAVVFGGIASVVGWLSDLLIKPLERLKAEAEVLLPQARALRDAGKTSAEGT